ncbi:LOW QUALITY PROTEIN: podocan [Alosa alosa]|nr:LOW QUALITY PROTEIN: podocan [Alosa alosa]
MGRHGGLLQLLCLVTLGWALVLCQFQPSLRKLQEGEYEVVEEEEEYEDGLEEVEEDVTVVQSGTGGGIGGGGENKKKATPSCPKECTCTNEGAVDCAGVNLADFPSDLSEDTRQLSLQNNQITEVTTDDLARLHQLQTLNLQNNRLTTQGLEDEGFEVLEQLNYLYLANNKLTAAPKHLPPSLVSADFAANQLTKIYPYTFGQKPGLKSVYLHNNKLTDAGLPEDMFNGSSSLEILIMSSNFLRSVPKNLPPALYRLHLKNNKLVKIPSGAFENLSNLWELCLQNNLLSNDGMDNETFSQLRSLEYLDLSNNNLTEVPDNLPRNLVVLHLEKNSIRSITASALIQVRNLEYLLLHNNQLRSRFIEPTAFRGLKKLHTLHMYHNMLERVPRGLPRRAKTLMLLHNRIAEIGRNDLILLYTLTELNLSYNRLTTSRLHREAFRKLRLLERLDLSGNGLHALPLGLPRSLQVLKVKDNQLNSIPDGALAGMSKLKEINLANNQLKLNSIYQGAWQEVTELTTLDLSGNLLSHVPPDLPESLEFLHLQNNRISRLPDTAFDGTPNIKGIFLRFNPLSVNAVKESSFAHLVHLQVLDIGYGNAAQGPGVGEEEEKDLANWDRAGGGGGGGQSDDSEA